MKQTAVEWLEEQTRTKDWHSLKRGDIIQQAKEIEKQQIINAFNEGWLQCNISGLPGRSRDHYETPEQYYNETFKK